MSKACNAPRHNFYMHVVLISSRSSPYDANRTSDSTTIWI